MKLSVIWTLFVFTITTAQAQDLLNKGRMALGAGDTTTAISSYQEALKAGQRAWEANYMLGAIAFQQRQIDDAIRYLEASVRLRDDNVDALKMLGDAYLQKNDGPSALTQFRRANRLAPKNCDVAVALGIALLAVDSVDAAIVHLTRAKECDPENAGSYAGLGDAYAKQGVPILAILNYQEALKRSPKNIPIRLKLAQTYEKNRQFNETIAQYDSITIIDSTYADAYLEKGKLLLRAAGNQKKLSVAPLRSYVQLRPREKEGLQLYARSLFIAEEYTECVKVSRDALALESGNVEMLRYLAHSLAETKDYQNALSTFDKLKQQGALGQEDYSRLAKVYFELKREDEALSMYLQAIEIDSSNCDPYFDLGYIYMKKQQYDKAAEMFEKRIGCDPRSLSSYVNAAASYMQIGNFPRAYELALKSVELRSDFLQGRLWLARVLAQMDSLEAAKVQYDEVIRIGEGDAKYRREVGEAYYLTGSYYFIRKSYDRSVDSFRKALSLGYENDGLHLSWGQALILSRGENHDENVKKIEEAVKRFRRCVELQDRNAQGHLWLAQGLIFMRVEGDNERNRKLTEEACSEYRKVLKLDPRNDDAKKGMERFGCTQ